MTCLPEEVEPGAVFPAVPSVVSSNRPPNVILLVMFYVLCPSPSLDMLFGRLPNIFVRKSANWGVGSSPAVRVEYIGPWPLDPTSPLGHLCTSLWFPPLPWQQARRLYKLSPTAPAARLHPPPSPPPAATACCRRRPRRHHKW